jgi:peroxiredoxin Q/BCP
MAEKTVTQSKKSPVKKLTRPVAKRSTAALKPKKIAKIKPTPEDDSSLNLSSATCALAVAATGEQSLSLKSFHGRRLVLYFYPKDNTPGCTTESQDFARLHPFFKKAGAAVLGISRDSVKSHEGFKQKFALPFDLLSDETDQLTKAFDVIRLKNMYGKKFLGIERSTFVFDEKGKLLRSWRKVKVEGHAQEVLNFIKEQGSK